MTEFIGAFGFCFASSAAIVMNHLTQNSLGLVGIALAHGLAFAALAEGGTACNPALTLAGWVAGRLALRAALAQGAAQLAGGVAGALLLPLLLPAASGAAVHWGMPDLARDGAGVAQVGLGQALGLEAAGTALLAWAWLRGGSGAAGAAVAVAVLIAGPLTSAGLNPARALGPALVTGTWPAEAWVYLVGPVLGGVGAGGLWRAQKG